MTTEELKKAMEILIGQHDTKNASDLIYKLWMDHDGYRVKKGVQVVRKNLEDLLKKLTLKIMILFETNT